jgi:hypothetical protein
MASGRSKPGSLLIQRSSNHDPDGSQPTETNDVCL